MNMAKLLNSLVMKFIILSNIYPIKFKNFWNFLKIICYNYDIKSIILIIKLQIYIYVCTLYRWLLFSKKIILKYKNFKKFKDAYNMYCKELRQSGSKNYYNKSKNYKKCINYKQTKYDIKKTKK